MKMGSKRNHKEKTQSNCLKDLKAWIEPLISFWKIRQTYRLETVKVEKKKQTSFSKREMFFFKTSRRKDQEEKEKEQKSLTSES